MRALLASLVLVAAGCAVRPYQREHLAMPAMQLEPAVGDAVVAHALESREGAIGGQASGGGSCGCN